MVVREAVVGAAARGPCVLAAAECPAFGYLAPSGVLSKVFTISCKGSGLGWLSAPMRGPTGAFGQKAARTMVCQ
jgi:hypothetical protein